MLWCPSSGDWFETKHSNNEIFKDCNENNQPSSHCPGKGPSQRVSRAGYKSALSSHAPQTHLTTCTHPLSSTWEQNSCDVDFCMVPFLVFFAFFLNFYIVLIFFMCIYLYNPNHSKATFILEKSPRLVLQRYIRYHISVCISIWKTKPQHLSLMPKERNTCLTNYTQGNHYLLMKYVL